MATAPQARDGWEVAGELLQRIGQAVGNGASASAVFGEPVERGAVTVIPVAGARSAFGGGGGSGAPRREGAGGGGGGCASVRPIGFIEIHDGGARFRRIPGPSDLLVLIAAASLAGLVLRRRSAG